MSAGQEIMLFYLVCDESGSMGPNGGIETINQSLPELHYAMVSDPLVVDKARLSIIAFSDEAEVHLPLTQVSEVAELPGVQVGGSTQYGKAFKLLRETIESDITEQKANGYRILRPCVFFITDGVPSDGKWQDEFDQLINHKWAPNVIAFGVDGARPDIIRKVGSLKAFMAESGVSAGPALASIMESVGQTVVQSVTGDGRKLVLPPPPPGVVDLDSVDLDLM